MFELINGYEKQRAHREMIRRDVARYQQADAIRAQRGDRPLYAVLAGMVEFAANANRNNGRSIMRVFKAIKLRSHTLLSSLTHLQKGCETC
jgi:hypothetical protein